MREPDPQFFGGAVKVKRALTQSVAVPLDLSPTRPALEIDPPPSPPGPPVAELSDVTATDPAAAGAKAASLARAAAAGLPVLDGFVVTTAAAAAIYGARDVSSLHSSGDDVVDLRARIPEGMHSTLRDAWDRLSAGGARTLIVRSSSTVEDGGSSSMAGMFTSVLGVGSWRQFVEAVWTVLTSAKAVAGSGNAPLAVLVQTHLGAARSGVLFGLDPVTGRSDRIVASVVEGGLDRLVGGEVDGTRHQMTGRGRLLDTDGGDVLLGIADRLRLARLAARAARVFGGPQDIEWAIDHAGKLWLFQSRPVTAVGTSALATGPTLGPGPVAETLPGVLAPLEQSLWVEPLARGIAEALTISGTAPRRKIAKSPVVTTVNGRAAADLDLLGVTVRPRPWLARLDPRAPIRRLIAAWRVGRLRAALPTLAANLVARVDSDLASVPPLAELDDDDLVGILHRGRQALVGLHGHEVLTGLLLAPGREATAAAARALRTLVDDRKEGLTDDAILARHPVVLTLVAPSVGPRPKLPPTPDVLPPPSAPGDAAAALREDLRLRARWVQELTGRAAWALGARTTRRGLLPDERSILNFAVEDVDAMVAAGIVPGDLAEPSVEAISPPLPAAFRLTPQGVPVAVQTSGAHDGGRGAGGGRGLGPVVHSAEEADAGTVLVVRTLDPDLAPALPGLAGLVAETGSVLSHLAILAREFGVPTAVGVPNALERFQPGAVVVVDGTTGEVAVEESAAVTGGAIA